MDLDLDGARAIVLAGSSGLGRASATELVRAGARVVVTSSDPDNLTAAVDDITQETGCDPDRVSYAVCDLSDPDSIENGLGEALDTLGGLDVLVTNHGGTTTKPFSEASLVDFDRAYETVLRSTIHACMLTQQALREGDGGAIVNLVSASALEPPATTALSNVIRPGIFGLSKTLANELGEDGVRVNCVCPRGVYTDRIDYKIDQLAEREGISIEEATQIREEELPLSRLGTTEEFGRVVAFLASPAAGFITGAVVPADGGWLRGAF